MKPRSGPLYIRVNLKKKFIDQLSHYVAVFQKKLLPAIREVFSNGNKNFFLFKCAAHWYIALYLVTDLENEQRLCSVINRILGFSCNMC